jgi:hypothetical protein
MCDAEAEFVRQQQYRGGLSPLICCLIVLGRQEKRIQKGNNKIDRKLRRRVSLCRWNANVMKLKVKV